MDEIKIKDLIAEFKDAINKDNTLDSISEHIKCIGHCPTEDNYRLWLFEYKYITVLLEDTFNGTYKYILCINDIASKTLSNEVEIVNEIIIDTMDIYCDPGHKVKFINDNGRDEERKSAAQVLDTETIYEVEYVNVHGWSSYVKLKGIDGTFNTVMFIDHKE